ncbi:Hypothetical protein CINCED_3A012912 [Cinara cedri]|uniref:Uncharacterized protein n=1 Tax=Cinara cedri TaxID=506608 RepID=A0A5E4NQJ6_9HEMI|nr:Hypothetical protein CINCED_3A012912 [Cinara cedri]
MATKSNFIDSDCNTDVEKNKFLSLQFSLRKQKRQSIFDVVVLKKKELQKDLNTVSAFMEIMIKTHKAVRSQLDENFNDLCNKYQNKKKDLDKNKRYKVCLNIIVDDLYKKYEIFKCHLKKEDEENKYLEEKINKLEKCLNEEKKNITRLKDQNHNHIKFLEQKSEELAKITQELVDKTDELNKEKEVTRKLKLKFDGFIQEVDNLKLEELQQIKNTDLLKTEIEIEKNHNNEFNQIVYDQQNQEQELTEVLEAWYNKIDFLKQMIEKGNDQADISINKLREEKSNVEKEKIYLDNEVKITREELNKLVHKNENLNTHMNELQCRLDTANKNSDEKQKLSMEKIEKIHKDTKKLIIDINSKNKLIIELEEELLETKKRYKTQTEKAHNLKIQLENLKHKQNQMPIKCEKSPIIDYNDYNSSVDRVLKNATLGNEKLSTINTTIKYIGRTNNFKEKNQVYENLITKCNTFINYFTK